MVPLPLFKLGSLLLRHVSKYGANHIKAQAHEHARFRAFAARYGQAIHQLNMRMSVALLRDPEAERRAKEKAEAPTVPTEDQLRREEQQKEKEKKNPGSTPKRRLPFQNIWKRKFRPLPEAKAVDLFADVIGDTFILSVAIGLILYEFYKSQQKPDINKERIDDLNQRFEDLKKREDQLSAAEEQQRKRFEALEEALKSLRDSKTKQPLLPHLHEPPEPTVSA